MTSTIVAGRNHISAQRDKHLSVKENPGKQLGASLPQKTPRKVLGDITGSITNSTQKARKPPVLGTPKPGLVPSRSSTSKLKPERGRGGGVTSASKPATQSAHEDLSELEHMAPPELDKPDVFTVPSYVKALKSFRPALPTGRRRGVCEATFDDCPPEPTRPKDRDEFMFPLDEVAPPTSSAHLPDLAELDMLLNNL